MDVSGIATHKCTQVFASASSERSCPQYSLYLCPQYGFMADGDNTGVSGSEDCLYLNVYVPESAGPENKLPVMMWIFGGYYIE